MSSLSALLSGGDKRDRTADPLLAKQVLSQLSYTPVYLGLCLVSLHFASLKIAPTPLICFNHFVISSD